MAGATAAALALGPCESVEAARSGGRFSGRRLAMRHSGLHHSHARLPTRGAPSLRTSAFHTSPLLHAEDILSHPALVLGLQHLPLWFNLVALTAFNLMGLAAVLWVLRNMGDNSEPVTFVKMQIGLLENHPHLQSKLAELALMQRMGQHGAWLIVEEAVLELLKHQSHIAYASVAVERLSSKKRAYALFGEVADQEARKAVTEEASVMHHGGETSEDEGASGSGLLGMLLGRRGEDKEAMVVTLLLATRGKLTFTTQMHGWEDLRHNLQQLTGLSSDKLMAVELLWTPKSEDDYLTKDQLTRDYPQLLPLRTASTA